MTTAITSVSVRSLPALLRAMQASGLSQREIARRAGTSATWFNQLVRGKRYAIGLDIAARIEDALDVPRGTHFQFPDPALAAPYAREPDGAAAIAADEQPTDLA